MATKQQHELILQKLRSKYGEKQTEQVNQDQDDNWWQKWIKDSSRFSGNFQQNLYQALEGGIDWGVSIVGSGLELIGLDEASKAVHDFGQRDLTKEFIGSDFNKYSTYFTSGGLTSGLGLDEWYESTYGQQERLPSIVEDFSSGLGNLAGMMIATKVGTDIGGNLGGNVGAKIGQWGSVMATSGGQSYEQALNEGASGYEATAYGIASGGTELASELVVGKLMSKIGLGTGKVLGAFGGEAPKAVNPNSSALGTAVKGIMKNFTEEGAEEVFSDLVNPLLQKATYKSEESLEDLYSQVTPESLVETFVIGGLLGAFTEGFGTVTGAKELGSLEAYNLSQEVRTIEDVNDKLEKALKKGDSKKYNELLAEKDEIVKQIETKYEKFLKDVKSGKTDIESIQKQMDEITKQLENGEINPEDVVKTKRQLLARQVDYETIKDVRATVAKEMLDTTFNGKVNIEVTTEKGVKGGFDVNTNTLTVNPANLDINNFVETLLHETFHGLANTEFINEMIKTFGSQEAYQQAYDKIYEVYSKNKNTKKALKKLNAEETKAYIDEEISANVFGATFKNVNQYMRAIKKMDAKGLERLIANIKTIFDGRNKPQNYREILRLMQERRTALNNGEVKPETTKTTKPTTKYSLAEDEDGFELDEEIKEEIVADDEIIETINLEEFDSLDIELDLLENELDEIDDYIEKLDEQTKRIYEIRKAKADLGNLFEECQYLEAPVELGFGRTKFDYEGTNRYILSSLTEGNSFTIRLIKLNSNEACFALIDENLNILKTTKEKVKLEYDVYFETQMDFAKMWFNTVPDMINEYVRETYMPSEEEINRTIGEVLDSLEAEQSNNFTEETDSEGNNLSEEVVKFNKNNKMRTRECKLPFSYHGTKNSGFSIFDANLDEQNSGNYKFSGNAVNFTTTNKEMATSYTLHKDFKIRNIYNDEIVAVAEKLINKYLVPELSTSNILEISIEISDNGKIKLRLPRLYYEEYEKLGSFYQSVVPVTIDEKGYVKFDAEYEDIRDLSNRDLWKNFGIFLDYIGEARNTLGEKIFELDMLENLFDINFGEVYAVYPYAENVLEVEGKNSNWNEIAFSSMNENVENFDEIVNKIIECFNYKNLFTKNKTIDLESWYSLSFEEIEINGKKIEPEYDGRNYSLEITDENGNKDTLDLDVIHLPLNAQKFYWDTKVIPYILEYFGIKTSTTNEIVRYALENGYDGVIIRDIYDYGSTGYINDNITTGDLYITLRTANQIKSVTNTRPTKDPDIRYSLDETQDESLEKDIKAEYERHQKSINNFIKTLNKDVYGTENIENFRITADLRKKFNIVELAEISKILKKYTNGDYSIRENLLTIKDFLLSDDLTKAEFAEEGYKYLKKFSELYYDLFKFRKYILSEEVKGVKKTNAKFEKIQILNKLISDIYKMTDTVYNEGIKHTKKIKREEKQFELLLKGNGNKKFSTEMQNIMTSLQSSYKYLKKQTEEDYKKQLEIAEERDKNLKEKREERTLSEEEKEELKKKQNEEARKSAEEFNKRIKEEELKKKQEEEEKAKVITPNKIKKGVRVKHSSFGNGTVSDFDNTFVTINFDNTEVGQKKMNLDFLIKNNKLELLEEELIVEQPITIENKQEETTKAVEEEVKPIEEETQPIIEEIKQEEPAIEVQPEVVKEKPEPKKKRKLVRKTFTTDEEITEFAKTLEQDSSIYIATKVLFKDDNAKTVKAVADVQSNMVFEKESAVEIVEKFKKHLSKKDIGLVFRGMSRTGAENHIFELLNSITDNHTEAEVRKEIANFIKSFLAKDVELDESSKKTLNNIIKDVVDNQGRESKIHEAVRLKSEEMLIGINQYYNELKKVELTNELLEENIEELEEKVKILNKDKQATEKQYNRVLSRVEALEKKLEKSKQINLDLSKKYKETIKNIKSQLQNEINDLKKKLSKTETKLRREQKKVEKREEQLEKYKNYKKLQETVKKVREEIKTGRMNVDLVPLIQEITNNFDNMSTRTTKPLRDAINKIYSKLNALAREGNIEFVADDGLIEAFDIVANATGNINDAEMGAYDYILKRLRQIAKDNYKERYIKHKTFTTPNGTQYAEGKINELRNEAISKKEELKQAFGGKANANTLKVLMNTSSPRVMAKFLDGYNENGINTKMFNALRVAETQKQKQIMRLLKPLNDFFKKNKKFGRLLGKRVDLLGITATNGELLSIYKLLQQTDSYEHIINNGFEVQGTEYVDFDTNEKLDKLKKTIEKHFNLGTNSVADEYLKLVKELFHEAKLMKIETDEKLFGFSELRREIQYEYFPIQVSQEYKKQIRPDNFLSSLMGVKNLSFNKGRTGNKGKLIIGDIDYIVSNYTRGMAFYYTSAELVRDYNSLYSGFVGDKTVLAHMNEVFKNTKNPAFVSQFIANMINDYQGIRKPPSFFEKLRSRTATYYLGLNIKVMAGQVSSYFSANTYLDVFNPKVVAMSFDKRLGEIEKPEYIKYRTFDSVVIQSETIGGLDSLNRSLNNIAQATTKGIQAMDALVIDRLWRIALAQNKVLEEGISKEERERRIAKATEQCELAVRETQDNYSVTERSAFARSDNIIAKLFNQFRSSQNQYWSMLIDSSMSIYTKKKLGQKVTKQDVTKLTRSATGILMQGVVYTAISMAMKALLSRKDDDEYDFSAWFTQFFNDSILGVVPAITNVINLEFDFDSEKFINVTWRDVEVSPLNLMLGSLQDLYNGGVDATEGQLGSMFSNFLNAFGKFFGIPTENVMKLGKALIVATTGETGYKVEAWLNGTEIGNKTKINSALKSNKTAKAKTYYTMYSNGIMPLDSDVIDLMFDLYSKGYENSYLKQIPDYFIIDGEQLEFDKTAFLSKYEKVSVALRKIKNNRNFKALSEEEQEACISKLVNGYYTLAKNTILGKELTNIQVLMDNDVDLSNEIIHLIKIAQFEANEKETKKEQVEKYLRKAKLDMRQKLLISYLAGYKISDENKTILKRYLTSRGVPLKVVKKLFEEEKDLTKLFS